MGRDSVMLIYLEEDYSLGNPSGGWGGVAEGSDILLESMVASGYYRKIRYASTTTVIKVQKEILKNPKVNSMVSNNLIPPNRTKKQEVSHASLQRPANDKVLHRKSIPTTSSSSHSPHKYAQSAQKNSQSTPPRTHFPPLPSLPPSPF